MWHKVYVVLRFFIYIVLAVYWVMALIVRLSDPKYKETFPVFVIIGIMIWINLWWSFVLSKLVGF